MKKVIVVLVLLVVLISAAFILQSEWSKRHYALPEGYTGGFDYSYNYGAPEMEYYWVESYEELLDAIEKLESHGSKIDKSLIFSYEGELFDTKYCFTFNRDKSDKIVFGEDPFDRYGEGVYISAWAFFEDVKINDLIYSNVKNYDCCVLTENQSDLESALSKDPDVLSKDLKWEIRNNHYYVGYEDYTFYQIEYINSAEKSISKEAFDAIFNSVKLIGNSW